MNKENMPKRPNGRHGPKVAEKPKNFKSSIKRLLKEIKTFRILIIISLCLAALGSILSILAPDQLSNLTDEISQGLVINQKHIKKLSTEIAHNIDNNQIKEKMIEILDIQLSNETIQNIMEDDSISKEDKIIFQNKLQELSKNPAYINHILLQLPSSIQKNIVKDSKYQNETITKEDKIKLLESQSNINNEKSMNFDLPTSISKVLLNSITIDKITFTSKDQIDFLKAMNQTNKKDPNTLYKNIDKLPIKIKKYIEPTMNISKIKKITFMLALLYICSALFTYIESILMTDVSNKFAKKLRSMISNKINILPLKYFDDHSVGDILSRVTNDIDTIAQSMNQSLATLVSSTTLFLGTIIMMFYTNWIMALTAIISSSLGFLFMSIILSNSQKYFLMRQKKLGELNGHIEEVYSGLNVVKAYNGKKISNQKFDQLNEELYEANRKSQFLSGIMHPMMGFIGNLGYVAVCIVGALLTMNDVISFGVIVAFITYVRLFTSPLSQIAQAMTSLQSTAAASERIFEFIDEKELEKEKNMKSLSCEKTKGKIEFDHVMFQYNEKENSIIKDFTAVAKPGQKIAIVGPTGAGKTTMVNLLMKFYEINSGDIKIDGISIKELSRENIHSLFTMVLQDTWLFEGTIKENIIYNRENISIQKVQEVCKIVGLDHFIKTLPKGYETKISDNDSISAGQRQLLTIARAMIQNSPFLILDEATSNVDTRTEELVQKAMDKLTEQKTSFIIAHRLSTIKNADLILVMKDGNIIEQGNHDELMKQNGFYKELYNSQFEI